MGRPQLEEPKKQVTLRVSEEVSDYLDEWINSDPEGRKAGVVVEELMREALLLDVRPDDSGRFDAVDDCVKTYWNDNLPLFLEFLGALTNKAVVPYTFELWRARKRMPPHFRANIDRLLRISPLVAKLAK